MSIKIMTKVWDSSVPANLKYVLLALADSANDNGKCWLYMKTLATKIGKGERQIQRDLAELEKLKLIKRVFKKDPNNPQKNIQSDFWVHKNPEKLFPVIEIPHTPDDDEPNPLDESVDNSTKNSEPVDNLSTIEGGLVSPMTPGGVTHDTRVVSSTTPITVFEPSMNHTATKKENDLLKKQAIEVCKQKRPDLVPEEIWEAFVDYYTTYGKQISLQKWENWIAKEKAVDQTPEQNRALSDNERCAKALAQFGIDYWTTQEQRTNQSWWAWMDANPHRRIK